MSQCCTQPPPRPLTLLARAAASAQSKMTVPMSPRYCYLGARGCGYKIIMLGNTHSSIPSTLFVLQNYPCVAFTKENSCRILVNNHLFGDVNYHFHNNVDTRSLTAEEKRRLLPSADFLKLFGLSEKGNTYFLKLRPGSLVCINKQSSIDLSYSVNLHSRRTWLHAQRI